MVGDPQSAVGGQAGDLHRLGEAAAACEIHLHDVHAAHDPSGRGTTAGCSPLAGGDPDHGWRRPAWRSLRSRRAGAVLRARRCRIRRKRGRAGWRSGRPRRGRRRSSGRASSPSPLRASRTRCDVGLRVLPHRGPAELHGGEPLVANAPGEFAGLFGVAPKSELA